MWIKIAFALIQTTRIFDYKIQFFSTAKINKFGIPFWNYVKLTIMTETGWIVYKLPVWPTGFLKHVMKSILTKKKTHISNQKILIVGMFIFSLPRDFNNQRINHDHQVFDVFSGIFVEQFQHINFNVLFFLSAPMKVGNIES